jgi:hypothetical protein
LTDRQGRQYLARTFHQWGWRPVMRNAKGGAIDYANVLIDELEPLTAP